MSNSPLNDRMDARSPADDHDTSNLPMDSTDAADSPVQQQPRRSPRTSGKKSTNDGRISRSKKAGLVFPVSRVEKHLRQGRYAERLSGAAPVYLASVLEYLVAEIVELAGDLTHKSRRKRLTPRDIALVIKNDHELATLCANVTIPEGGVQPFIHQVLLQSNQRRRSRPVKSSPKKVNPSSAKRTTFDDGDSDMDTDANLSS